MRLEQISQNLKMLDKKHFDVRQYILVLKQDRDEVKNNMFRNQVKFQNCVSAQTKLDREIEDVLGRAVNQNDLSALHKLDLKTINQIDNGKNEQLHSLAQSMAATKIQALFRSVKARMDTKIMLFKKKVVANKLGTVYKAKKLNFQLGATLLIQRVFRKRRAKREYLKHLEFKNQNKSV